MKVSSKKAIANHCKECTYDPLSDGTWRQQVQACTITKCHLYEFRPITLKSISLRRENILASLPVNGAQKPPIHGCKSQLPSQKIIRI